MSEDGVTVKQVEYDAIRRQVEEAAGGSLDVAPKEPTSLAKKAAIIVDPIVNSPAITTAMQVLDSVSEIGKVLPFIAPAFVLLKIIIDMEKRAQDVDAKCNDLLERITFMLGHMKELQSIKDFKDATIEVINRIIDAIKDAAALFAAYRKQSRVARRLSLSNRDKFTTCAQTINTCCSDLLTSLQIHQTVKLDILTRPVPMDEGDRAGRAYVDANGGSVDAVTHSRELVAEFARQQHLSMDDAVMEQLRSNIADSMEQYHLRLESILRDNLSSAISEGLKNHALELSALEAEVKFACVQCDKEFTSSTDGPSACSYHRWGYDAWREQYPCCSTARPCQFGTHRTKHHCDYSYATFFSYVSAILGYLDTNTTLASVEDTNLETEEIQEASVRQLHRWISGGVPVEQNTLLVVVGTFRYPHPYYFNAFTAKELEDIAKSISLSQHTLIFRTSDDENEYASAEWVLSDAGEITGIRISAKSTTSTDPWVRVCPIDLPTCTQSGEVLTTSEGGMRSFIPDSPYVLPETISFGPILKDTQTRPIRTFKSKTTTSLRVILKSMSEPALAVNSKLAQAKCDFFVGKVSVFNNNTPGSSHPVTITSVSASYRMVGDAEYVPVRDCKLVDGLELPVTIDPRQSCLLNFQLIVPHTEEDSKLEIRWWDRSFVARHRPVRIKLVIEDIEGEQCSLVMEHVAKPSLLPQRAEKDLGFFFFDNPLTFDRNYVRVESVNSTTEALRITTSGNVKSISVNTLEKVVYQARKTGKTEVDLEIGEERNLGEWEWSAWALVDLSCQRVYAFKFMLNEGSKVPVKRLGTLGYVLCPNYGVVVNTTRPISYATETVKLPAMEAYPMPEYVQDDDLDDFKPVASVSAVPPGAEAVSTSIPTELMNRLASMETKLDSIDANLARIAAAFEKLVTIPGVNNSEK